MGNHEDGLIDYIKRLRGGEPWATVKNEWEHSYLARDMVTRDADYVLSLPLFIRLPAAGPRGQDVLVVHAGMVPGTLLTLQTTHARTHAHVRVGTALRCA